MKATHLLSIITGSLSALVVLFAGLSEVLGWHISGQVIAVGGLLAAFINTIFGVLTGVKVANGSTSSQTAVTATSTPDPTTTLGQVVTDAETAGNALLDAFNKMQGTAK